VTLLWAGLLADRQGCSPLPASCAGSPLPRLRANQYELAMSYQGKCSASIFLDY
jgi:hypothetical protein